MKNRPVPEDCLMMPTSSESSEGGGGCEEGDRGANSLRVAQAEAAFGAEAEALRVAEPETALGPALLALEPGCAALASRAGIPA